MSRGAGWVERAILDALSRNTVLDTFQVTAAVFDCRPQRGIVTVSDAQLASVRRALRNLEEQGRVAGAREFGRKRCLWSLPAAGPGPIPSATADQSPFDTDKLVKILGMLGSAHPGEVAAAGTAAHKLITEARLRWQDLITGAKAQR